MEESEAFGVETLLGGGTLEGEVLEGESSCKYHDIQFAAVVRVVVVDHTFAAAVAELAEEDFGNLAFVAVAQKEVVATFVEQGTCFVAQGGCGFFSLLRAPGFRRACQQYG